MIVQTGAKHGAGTLQFRTGLQGSIAQDGSRQYQ
ncbi:hypothetical protein HNR62_001827 [Oceanisphaera litoralis]|nr:hypothetical protein [Oceanisphaera litoralis]